MSMSEEDMVVWQDVLDLILANRAEDLDCPFCGKGKLKVTQRERVTRVHCPTCRKFIEGAFSQSE